MRKDSREEKQAASCGTFQVTVCGLTKREFRDSRYGVFTTLVYDQIKLLEIF